MSAALEAESTLTDRYQTTVPESVRRILRLNKRDRIHYSIRPDGAVLLSRVKTIDEDDPALAPFLDFLAQDMARNPAQLKPVAADQIQRLQALTDAVEFDLDAPLSTHDG